MKEILIKSYDKFGKVFNEMDVDDLISVLKLNVVRKYNGNNEEVYLILGKEIPKEEIHIGWFDRCSGNSGLYFDNLKDCLDRCSVEYITREDTDIYIKVPKTKEAIAIDLEDKRNLRNKLNKEIEQLEELI